MALILDPASSPVISATALTDLDSTKSYLRITDVNSDAILTSLINQVSLLIELACGRKFLARDYRLRLNTTMEQRIVLPNPPIQYVTRVAYGRMNCLSITYTTAADLRANVSVYHADDDQTTGGMRLDWMTVAGVHNTLDLPFATYPTATLLAAHVNGLANGWTFTVQTNCATVDMDYFASGEAKSRNVFCTFPSIPVNDYTVDGIYGYIEFRWPWGHHFTATGGIAIDNPPRFFQGMQRFLVEYRGGFEAIPADVALVAQEIIAKKYYIGARDPAGRSQTLGPFSASYETAMIYQIREQLGHYIDSKAMIA